MVGRPIISSSSKMVRRRSSRLTIRRGGLLYSSSSGGAASGTGLLSMVILLLRVTSVAGELITVPSTATLPSTTHCSACFREPSPSRASRLAIRSPDLPPSDGPPMAPTRLEGPTSTSSPPSSAAAAVR